MCLMWCGMKTKPDMRVFLLLTYEMWEKVNRVLVLGWGEMLDDSDIARDTYDWSKEVDGMFELAESEPNGYSIFEQLKHDLDEAQKSRDEYMAQVRELKRKLGLLL